MEIAADVINVNSMLLISKGTILIPRHIRLLKTWGVESVRVVNTGDEAGVPARIEIPVEILRAAETYVTKRFSHITAMNDQMRLIRALAIKRAAMRMFKETQSAQPQPKP